MARYGVSPLWMEEQRDTFGQQHCHFRGRLVLDELTDLDTFDCQIKAELDLTLYKQLKKNLGGGITPTHVWLQTMHIRVLL